MPRRIPRWFLWMIAVSLGWYLTLASGAADRARLKVTDTAIAGVRADIRTLEIEFAARASLGQIARWSAQIQVLAAPRPDQFVAEVAFAAIHPVPPAPALPVAAAAARRPADRPAPQLAMLDQTLQETSRFGGIAGVSRAEGRGLR